MASMKSHVHFENVFLLTPPARVHNTRSFAYTRRNMSVQRRWDIVPDTGTESDSTRAHHKFKQTRMPHPKYCRNIRSSLWTVPFLRWNKRESLLQINRAWYKKSSGFGADQRCRLFPSAFDGAMMDSFCEKS